MLTILNPGGGLYWQLPEDIQAVWNGEGEWEITLRVFRDLGIAFGVALLGIFLVLRIQTGLSAITGIIMLAIPLFMIGIMPGFWFLNQVGEIDRIFIPSAAVTQVGQLDFVIVTSAHGTLRRYVRLGERATQDRIEVVSGLTAGEEILITAR